MHKPPGPCGRATAESAAAFYCPSSPPPTPAARFRASIVDRASPCLALFAAPFFVVEISIKEFSSKMGVVFLPYNINTVVPAAVFFSSLFSFFGFCTLLLLRVSIFYPRRCFSRNTLCIISLWRTVVVELLLL